MNKKTMKKLFLLLYVVTGILISLSIYSCGSNEEEELTHCGTHNSKTLYIGPRDGCYYINSNDNKTYVDREECDC